MAQGLFVTGFTVAEVQAIQARAKALVLEGKTIMESGAGSLTGKKEFTMPVREVLEECAYALKELAPETYGRRVTRTVPRYL
jgi:hypothetical protein